MNLYVVAALLLGFFVSEASVAAVDGQAPKGAVADTKEAFAELAASVRQQMEQAAGIRP